MKIRLMIPVVGVVVAMSASAAAQTAAAPAAVPRPAVAAAVAAPDQTPPPVPPVAATAPQAPTAPRSPQAPPAPRPARMTTGEGPALPEARRTRGQLVNLHLEFTVTDQIGTAPPMKKTITMNVADGESGRIRTNAEVHRKNAPVTTVPLSVDASPEIDGSRIRLRASLEYQLLKDAPEPDVPAGKTSITQSVTAILNDGVTTILSQSADPLTDRKVTLEVKATIIK
jgi:hypothetical protein